MITITKQFEFAAAHKLPYHEGLCKNLHGHSYKLEVTIGKKLKDLLLEDASINDFPSKGMVMDFKTLKNIIQKNVIDHLDHAYLNNFVTNPTAELLVIYILGKIGREIEKQAHLIRIRLWESSTSYAEWKA